MSKAFTREENDGPDIPDLPPLASTLPEGARNYMTAAGANRLREELAQLVNEKRPALVVATDDPAARRQVAMLDQRIRQLEQSLQSAEIVLPPKGAPDTVRFGATVTVRENNGEESTYRIVGADETDSDRGWVSAQSPIARALLNSKLGERVRFRSPAGDEELEIIAVSHE